MDDLVQQRRRGVAGEGRPARRRVRRHRARGEDVRRARDALAEDLLGGMQPGEPIDTPVDVRDAVPSGARAMPKSMSSGPSRARRTFEGFTSRCTRPRSCTAAGASAGPAPSPRTVAAGSGPVSATAAARDGPAEQPVGPHGRGLVPFERPHPSTPPP
ncbi:hypothetical protein [Streptomyces viridosporus]|uniref:hypothetical protein n=1 Tax=Streptomyces viridosporus TaxID=67581 RepID=UPI003D9FA235